MTTAQLRALLPADVASRGYVTVVSDTSFGPPMIFNPSGNATEFSGVETDLANVIFPKLLGLQIHWTNSPFAGNIPSVVAGRYDIAMNGLAIKAAREKQIDMVHYINDSDGILVAQGNPLGIKGLADLCGKQVSVVTATTQAALILDYQSQCQNKMTITQLSSKADVYLHMKSGRSVASIVAYNGAAYLGANPTSGFEGLAIVQGVRLDTIPLGFGVSKQQAGLAAAMTAAINQMIADGTYQQILAKWHLETGAVSAAELNPPSQ
jgi:polar amino acid transport system substrate-binding protein